MVLSCPHFLGSYPPRYTQREIFYIVTWFHFGWKEVVSGSYKGEPEQKIRSGERKSREKRERGGDTNIEWNEINEKTKILLMKLSCICRSVTCENWKRNPWFAEKYDYGLLFTSHFWCGERGEKTWMFLIGFDLQI
jgi:hypothetical protein